MHLEIVQYALGAISGGLVGLTLGLFGGGGSILAVPLMVYLVGVTDAHIAIGTSAVAVAANAATNLITHARRGNVRWRCALIYSAAGIAGAFLGSLAGKALDGGRLLFLFALLMLVVGGLMVFTRNRKEQAAVACTIENAPKTLACLWCRHWRTSGLLRHRRRVPDRSGPGRSDRHDAAERDRLSASRGPTSGIGFSASSMRPGSTKIAAFILGVWTRMRRLEACGMSSMDQLLVLSADIRCTLCQATLTLLIGDPLSPIPTAFRGPRFDRAQ